MSGGQLNAFRPLRHREFALLWWAGLASNIGGWMHDMAAGWTMATLNTSPAMVALVQAATTLPVCLLAFAAGTLADRVDKRRLLIAVQIVMVMLAAALALLVQRGAVEEWSLLMITLALGACTAIVSPTWQSIIPRLVPREDLPSAVALHAVGVNISRAIGPAVGGLLIISIGLAVPFWVNAVSFLFAITATWHWQGEPARASAATDSFLAAMRSGLQHARANPALRAALWRSAYYFTFSSVIWALLPVIARDHLNGEANLYGFMVAAVGVGAVSCALALPQLRHRFGLNRLVHICTVLSAITACGYALANAPWLGLLISLFTGVSWLIAVSSLNVAAQMAVPEAMRGRGMSLFTTALYGSIAVGSIVWGQLAELWHSRAALLIAAGLSIVLLPLAIRRPLRS